MKIEKLNDRQIRCTLTAEDLIARKIHLTELAYGSDKAQSLFKDMMLQARNDFGFDASDSSLMVEAIPTSPDTLVLIITKVDNPEELDTRFSKFTVGKKQGEAPKFSGADNYLNMIRKNREFLEKGDHRAEAPAPSGAPEPAEKAPKTEPVFAAVAAFKTLENAIEASFALSGSFAGSSTLYKYGTETPYRLLIRSASLSPETFNQICNVLSEYAPLKTCAAAAENFLNEHAEQIISENAVQTLFSL